MFCLYLSALLLYRKVFVLQTKLWISPFKCGIACIAPSLPVWYENGNIVLLNLKVKNRLNVREIIQPVISVLMSFTFMEIIIVLK